MDKIVQENRLDLGSLEKEILADGNYSASTVDEKLRCEERILLLERSTSDGGDLSLA